MSAYDNIYRSTLLSSLIFWIILLTEEDFRKDWLDLYLISLIPISIGCAIVISLSILPFFAIGKKRGCQAHSVFSQYFPYYAIVCFFLTLCGIYSNESLILRSFFISAYLTTCQSWVWFSKSRPNDTLS